MSLSPSDMDAVRLSVKVATAATLVSLPAGFTVAYLLSFASFRGKTVAEVVVNLPLTLPPVVIGYLLLLFFGKNGPAGKLLALAGTRIIFTWEGAAVASAVVGFPLLVRAIRLAMEGVEPGLLAASRTLGASPLDTLFTITLPLSFRGIAAGSALMFGRSLGEFGATIIVAGNIPGVTQTIPLAIYDHAASPSGEGEAMTLCLVAILLSACILLFHEWLAGRLTRRS